MSKRYSRLAQVEEKKAKRKAFIYITLTLSLIIIIFLFGIGFLSNFADFITNLAGSSKPIEILDKTPPAPPKINTPPESTNKTRITISGTAEAGTTINIYFNKSKNEIIATAEGTFSESFSLRDGKNTVYAMAIDKSGNESTISKTFTIVYDNTPPQIEITKPSDGESFYGSPQKQLTIEGSVEPNSSLTINDRIAVVSSNGSFSYSTTLNEGDNSFEFKAEDQAGNKSQSSLTVSFNL